MKEHIIQLRDEISEAVQYMNAILETIDRGAYGADEAVFDLDNLNIGAITLLLQKIAEGSDEQ